MAGGAWGYARRLPIARQGRTYEEACDRARSAGGGVARCWWSRWPRSDLTALVRQQRQILTKKKTVKTEAGLTIGPFLLIPGTPPVTVSCKFRDAERLENPASGAAGVDEMKVFTATECGPNPCPVNSAGVQPKFKVKALGLPWKTELVEVPPIADEIQGAEI